MTVANGFDLTGIRAGIKEILRDISGCGEQITDRTHRPVAEEDAAGVYSDDVTLAVCSFKLISVVSLGFGDEVRREYDPDLVIEGDTSGPPDEDENPTAATGGFTVEVCGNRVLTFSIRVECYDQDKTAFEYVEKIRSHLGRPSIDDRIVALGCSVNDIRGSRDTSFAFEGRQVSQAGFDLVLNTVSNVADDNLTTIETVHATGSATL